MAQQRPIVAVRGLAAFRRALRKANRTLDLEVRRGFRAIAKRVADDARALARQRTTRRTGDLIRGIRPFARQRAVGVMSAAEHRDYPYPRRLEFEGRGGDRYGPRASLFPAVERHEHTFEREAMRVLDLLARDWSNTL